MCNVVRLKTAAIWLLLMVLGSAVSAQPLTKSAIQVDPGNTKLIGATFGYRLTYNCSSTSGPCVNAEVVDLLPAEVQYVSTVPSSPTGDVAAITVTPNFGGSGRTRVRFLMLTPLTAGNSGDLIINVRFPNGSTPNGTVAINSADGINLGASPGTFTTPPVNVTAVGSLQATLQKTLLSSPANLDLPESYRLRIAVSGSNGSLNLTAVGPVVDTLPPGTVFNGATPAADCEPGCVGTTPATLTWTSPCSLPVAAGSNCDITVNVVFPSATFPSGTNVTNSFTTSATPLGQPPQSLGVGTVTHPVTTFVASPSMSFSKNMAGGTPNPPTLNQSFSYDLNFANNGNVPLDNLTIIDTLPVSLQLSSVSTGAYNNLANVGAGEGVRVSYEKNTAPGVFTLWGSSPGTGTNTTLTAPAPGLGAGEYLTRVRWEMGTAAVGMGIATRPLLSGSITNPDNAGNPVAIGSTIQNCADLTAVYSAGPTNVNRNACRSFTLSGPFVQLNPAKDNLSGGGPFNPGQTVSWRLRVRSAAQSSDPVALSDLIATDLLPINLNFVSWNFDAQGTGLPAPQVFEQIPNFAGTGRTLLRWRWNAGSGNLGVNQQVWINLNSSIRNGTPSGSLSNDFTLDSDAPGLSLRCSGGSQSDPLDLDGDADTGETLCRATGTVTVAGIAQLVSSKTIQGTCDGGSVASSSGTLLGGAIDYTLRVQNVGTVPMQNFVLIDILPFVGDSGVRDTSPRGSLWTPLLAAPITPPAGTTLYYSTSGNPCRGEVGGPTTSCDAPNWTTVPPVPITSVRSYKIEFGSRVVQPFDFLTFNFLMVTPGTVPAGQQAFNSFAYQADRADGLGSLAAEPQKVGISIGACNAASLGDYVWADANANGLQDDGPTGINGVPVFLWQPGTDGIAGTLDDVPVSSSITGNGPTNAPGWYSFPGLAPGSYFVCIAAPPTFVYTTPDVGGNDSLDSDANPSTGCAPTTVLGANETNPTLDFGIVPTQRAALGNYVWFDRNGNGTQNESPFDGANGVTVRLWIDDGDGVTEPGTGDTLAATTVTDNDLYGAPGYYLFNGLVPGVSYFVQFIRPAVATAFTGQNLGGDDSIDSDAALSNGVTALVTLAPSEVNLSVDAGLIVPGGVLSLGDQVWNESDNDGVFEPENGELGVDGVRLDLYRDVNNDGAPTLDEYLATTTTATASGFAGRYGFGGLAAGNYLVVVAPQNFGGGGDLFMRITATGNDPAPDPDDDVNGDDNGTDIGALIGARPVTLSAGGEPTSEDGDNNTNLTVDFGFIPAAAAAVPEFDYGDAPDVVAGTASGDYNTTVLDTGAAHLIGVPGAPRLGACVDGDAGFNQGVAADRDDAAGFGSVIGACATAGDDEDGVSFTGPFVPGAATSFAVSASNASCVLNAWVDWNRSGVFGDSAGEQIASNLNVPIGPATVLSPVVPLTAAPGRSYARFRCSSAGGVGPTGPAADGEVEDYVIGIQGRDYPDAPASYGTSGVGAANHAIDPLDAVYLGACVDFETDGQPNVAATGDDLAAGSDRVGLCFDDEDGVSFSGPIAACATAAVNVSSSAAGRLDAFIDFNADGDFVDPGEQIFANQALLAGANALNFAVPCNAAAAVTYSRFRLTRAGTPGLLGPTGNAGSGEVEDYRVTVLGNDLGDAPAPFATLVAANGARHAIDPGSTLRLGACVDTEADGQPNAGATGDDLGTGSATVGTCALAGDDEDGVSFQPLVACRSTTMSVSAGAAGRLDAWADLNRDGDWDDAGERIASNLAVLAGANPLTVAVPCNASRGLANFRFRLSSAGVASYTGAAADGEIEDYQAEILAFDLGDLPDGAAGIGADNYRTLLRGPGDNGPQHRIVSSLFLGAGVDNEADGQPGAAADGDDLAGATPDDEDGITLADLDFTTGLPATVRALVTNTTGNAGRLCGFADLNADGDFLDANESAFVDIGGAVNAATVTLSFGTLAVNPAVYNLLPPNAPRYFRFRLADDQGACVADNDAAVPNGEVEDYLGNLFAPTDFGDLPDSGAGISAANYETLLANGGPYHPIRAGLQLGACVDAENNGQPGPAASGDDLGTGGSVQGSCADAGADEDGLDSAALAQLSHLIAGGNNPIRVLATNTTGVAARLCGFVDFNGDGDFADAGETQSASVNNGSNNAAISLVFAPALVAQPGTRYARFRLSTDVAGPCNPNGPASDGEVEDYTVGIRLADFGDLPDTAIGTGAGNYVTLRGDGRVAHDLTATATTLFLGAGVDAEGDGQPTSTADGDDLNGVPDDEDGLNPADLIQIQNLPAIFRFTATNQSGASANLCGYVDWNSDGDFDDAGEFASSTLASGASGAAVILDFGIVPAFSKGDRYARFRYSNSACAALPASGDAPGSFPNGEVEDYVLRDRASDLGDLPDTGAGTGVGNYQTTLADGGPIHGIVSGLRLGACVDSEDDGQTDAAASGDDLGAGNSTLGSCALANDDEDGITLSDLDFISTLPALIGALVTNTTGNAATLCGFVDWNGDGDFADTVGGVSEAAQVAVPDGSNNLAVSVDFGNAPVAPVGVSYARFRLSTDAGCSAVGVALDGEVEDYPVTITRRDFGDLPDTGVGTGTGNYQTLVNDNGAAHDIVDDLYLGALVDPEGDGQPNVTADGDDNAGTPDDEEGVNLSDLANFHLGSPANLRVIATNTTGVAAQICGFVDWNQDGDFADSRESASVPVPNGSSGASFTLSFGPVPSFGPLGQTYARVRLQNADTACTPNGLVDAGEVEDYSATVLPGEMSLGNLVWQDRDNSGTVSSGEVAFAGIPVALFRDANDDGTPDGPAIATDTTTAAGIYRFDELVPDTYLVCITAPIDWISSTGIGRPYAPAGPTEPALDPDNDINNNDDGTVGTPVTQICSRGLTLVFQNEPTNDGDGDNNSNLTVDFGLLYNFDLALRKTLSPGQNQIVAANQLVNFTIELFNQGTVVARNVVVTDTIPLGMILEDSNWTAGPGNTATRTLAGPLAPGSSIQTTIALRLTNMALPGELRNLAEISSAEDSQGQPVPLILDRDSDPDGNPDNDVEVDDEIGNAGGDEDDADSAIVILPVTPIPALNPLGLLLLSLTLLGLAMRRIAR
jgi:large repetitive protein